MHNAINDSMLWYVMSVWVVSWFGRWVGIMTTPLTSDRRLNWGCARGWGGVLLGSVDARMSMYVCVYVCVCMCPHLAKGSRSALGLLP